MTDLDLDRLMELAQAATPGPWEYGDRWHIAGCMSQFGDDKCVYCDRLGTAPTWTGRMNINGKMMPAHVHTSDKPWHPHGMYAVRDDGPICIINDTDEYGYLDPADAAFIAACDPDTVTGLIQRVREAEAKGRTLAEIDATYQTELGHRCAAAEAERDRLRAGITAALDAHAHGTHCASWSSRHTPDDCDCWKADLRALCSPTADTPREDKP